MDSPYVCPMGTHVGGNVVRVTVLMAVWRTPLAELAKAIESILIQTFSNFEFLIVDDGNTDPGLGRQLDGYAQADPRIRLAREPHQGLTLSLNRGLGLARGEYIARQDSDDWSEPQRLERQLAFFAAHPAAVLCGANAWMHQHDGRALWRTRLPQTHAHITAALAEGNPFVHGAAMFQRQKALDAGGYRAELKCSQDYDFFWRLSERGEAANLGEPLYHYRFSSGSVSAGKALGQALTHHSAIFLAAARRAGQPEDVARALAHARQIMDRDGGRHRAQLKQADHLMLAGDYAGAWKAYRKSLARHPASPLAWGKLARLGVFYAVPAAREACFR